MRINPNGDHVLTHEEFEVVKAALVSGRKLCHEIEFVQLSPNSWAAQMNSDGSWGYPEISVFQQGPSWERDTGVGCHQAYPLAIRFQEALDLMEAPPYKPNIVIFGEWEEYRKYVEEGAEKAEALFKEFKEERP